MKMHLWRFFVPAFNFFFGEKEFVKQIVIGKRSVVGGSEFIKGLALNGKTYKK